MHSLLRSSMGELLEYKKKRSNAETSAYIWAVNGSVLIKTLKVSGLLSLSQANVVFEKD